jgi:hypothetical protein
VKRTSMSSLPSRIFAANSVAMKSALRGSATCSVTRAEGLQSATTDASPKSLSRSADRYCARMKGEILLRDLPRICARRA